LTLTHKETMIGRGWRFLPTLNLHLTQLHR
jgi:hypothetical protein